jgi:hypothetical protein
MRWYAGIWAARPRFIRIEAARDGAGVAAARVVDPTYRA